ncbi:MAG: FAD-dependent oxidoreductase, partial [Rhodobacteraceae bacterium]
VNCAGTNAKGISKMVNCDLPVEARKRFSFVFDSEEKLDKKVPLTIDPSGIHFRSDGGRFLAGCGPSEDFPVDRSDFSIEENIWEDKVWPVLANRVSIFDRIKLVNWWVGHYAFNTFDQNAIIGSHPGIKNFFFLNGFSGHGLQQSPAMGRGISELIIYNEFRTLDLSTLEFERIRKNERVLEKSII